MMHSHQNRLVLKTRKQPITKIHVRNSLNMIYDRSVTHNAKHDLESVAIRGNSFNNANKQASSLFKDLDSKTGSIRQTSKVQDYKT